MNCDNVDIHILINTVHAPSILNSPASASYIPVCLPKFNPSGFVNAYISFLRKDDESSRAGHSGLMDMLSGNEGREVESRIALVCISAGGDFETIRTWCDGVTQVN
jgi:hypothetical protein